MASKESNKGPINKVALVAIVVLFLPLAYSIVSYAASPGPPEGELFLEEPVGDGGKCAQGMDAEYMRFHHWELLQHVREEVVRYGHRGDDGLSSCANCHQSRERFCDKCHERASVLPDCFTCHYYP